MRLDPENKAVQGVTTFLTFVALNLIYLATCVPVVTIGAATAALYEVTFRYADQEKGYLIKGYFQAIRRNALQATAVYLAVAVPLAMLGFSAVFWFSFEAAWSGAAAVVAVLACSYLLAALLYGLALVATHTNSTRQTLKNAFLLPVAEPVRTLWIVLVPVTCAALLVAVPGFGYLLGTIGFSFGAYASSPLFRRVFARHGDAEGAPD